METVNTWLIEMVKKNPDFNLNPKGGGFTPRAYRLSIIKDLEVHEIINFIKNDQQISDYNTLMDKVTKAFEQLRAGLPSVYEIDKLSSFIYFITVTKKFDRNNIDDAEEFLADVKEKENAFKFIEDSNSMTIEKLVYVGETMDIKNRFIGGHSALTQINKHTSATKKIYIAQVHVLETTNEMPYVNFPECLDAVNPPKLVENILKFLESLFITYYGIPEFNYRDKEPKVKFSNDPWEKIVGPEFITITEYQNSILFRDGAQILMYEIDNLLKPVIEKFLSK
ncbi:hypothetical protein [Aneurinibacillus uraniidurans]|uniref:hypothetical protein n=1 Tax=Aneurinibacillus uraniidurans TaxID=2966586 RepID=UPI00234B197F|nr:hypothetical protein [Aneurinibacillus sp. B1]WCN36485.1 hypothetical protein PO771_11385 [Aneurinibacillus sp. B1]